MILSTTPALEGYEILEYIGFVSGHAIVGANAASDFLASFTGFLGGRSTAYEKKLRKAEEAAMAEIQAEAEARGATAVVGIHVDFETLMIKEKDVLLAMAASGTAVRAERRDGTRTEQIADPLGKPKSNWDNLSPLVDTGRANRPA